jgi:hypothetical protein
MHGDFDLLKRKEPTPTPADGARRLQDVARTWAVLGGFLILFGTCLYRRIRHPDWTGGQALAALWPLYLAGVVSICSGWLLKDGAVAGAAMAGWRPFLHFTYPRRASKKAQACGGTPRSRSIP